MIQRYEIPLFHTFENTSIYQVFPKNESIHTPFPWSEVGDYFVRSSIPFEYCSLGKGEAKTQVSDDWNMLVPSHSLNSTGSQGSDSIARHIEPVTRSKWPCYGRVYRSGGLPP